VGGITQLFRIYIVVPVVDLNADVGEWDTGDSRDAGLMSWITSANVACGVHAGNAEVMESTVKLAARYGVAVGAHPSLNDRESFGRREQPVTDSEIAELITVQVATLARIAAQQFVRLRHVKPHGALYNMAARSRRIAAAIAAAVAAIDRSLVLVGLAGSELIAAGHDARLVTASEGFADRGYLADGSLAPRSMPGAVITAPDVVAARAVALVCDGRVVAMDGTSVPVAVDTICLHGDTPGAAALAQRVRAALHDAGVQVSAPR
jgi:5-oxoprolinase (ATP-hydrolysing) subunit A